MESESGIRVIPGSDRQVIFVPARRHLKHALFSIPAQLTGRKRKAALDLKIEAWSPFQQVAYFEVWNGNEASVLAWDRDAIDRKLQEYGYQPRQVDVVPETFIREPYIAGVRLVETSDGVEGQVWKDGFLTVSRWWADRPNAQEWNLFTRSAGQARDKLGATLPEPINPGWLETPWNRGVSNRDLLTQVLTNKAAVAVIVAAVIAPCCYFASSWMTYTIMGSRINAKITEVEVDGRAVRQERNRAINTIEYAETLSGLRRFPHQIEIISQTHSLLTPYSVEVAGWDYDTGVLEFGLQSEADMDATQFIPMFENNPMFYRVSSSTRGDRLVMRMNVTPTNELTP